jgi:hypothetical protein
MFTILEEDEATYHNTCFGGPLIYMKTIFSKSNMQEVQNTHLHLMPRSWMCAALLPHPLKHINVQVHNKFIYLHSIIICGLSEKIPNFLFKTFIDKLTT